MNTLEQALACAVRTPRVNFDKMPWRGNGNPTLAPIPAIEDWLAGWPIAFNIFPDPQLSKQELDTKEIIADILGLRPSSYDMAYSDDQSVNMPEITRFGDIQSYYAVKFHEFGHTTAGTNLHFRSTPGGPMEEGIADIIAWRLLRHFDLAIPAILCARIKRTKFGDHALRANAEINKALVALKIES